MSSVLIFVPDEIVPTASILFIRHPTSVIRLVDKPRTFPQQSMFSECEVLSRWMEACTTPDSEVPPYRIFEHFLGCQDALLCVDSSILAIAAGNSG